MTQSLYFDDIGEIIVRQSKRSKRMRMTVKPLQPLNISIPYGTKPKTLKKFIFDNKDWIIQNLEKVKTTENKRTVFLPETEFRTKYRELKLLPILKTGKPQFQLKKQTLIVRYAEHTDIRKPLYQEMIREAIEKTLRSEAKYYLPQRVSELAERHNLPVNKVTVRKAKTRWGSCSSLNNISLNIHLMRLPEALIDYVILHELAHTKHKNHSKLFWEYLEEICPDSKQKNRALNEYSPVIW